MAEQAATLVSLIASLSLLFKTGELSEGFTNLQRRLAHPSSTVCDLRECTLEDCGAHLPGAGYLLLIFAAGLTLGAAAAGVALWAYLSFGFRSAATRVPAPVADLPAGPRIRSPASRYG